MRSTAQTFYNIPEPLPSTLSGRLHTAHRFSTSLDVLLIAGRYILAQIGSAQIPATLVIGTLRFSLVRLYQNRIAAAAPFCNSITIYGEADCEPPHIPGVVFAALPPESSLCNEWFLVVDNSEFWGGILSKITRPEGQNGPRPYLFDGAVVTDVSAVEAAIHPLLAMAGISAEPVTKRYDQIQRRHWAAITEALEKDEDARRLGVARLFAPGSSIEEIDVDATPAVGVASSALAASDEIPMLAPAGPAIPLGAALAGCGAAFGQKLHSLRSILTDLGNEGGLAPTQLALLGQAMRMSSGLVLLSNMLARFPTTATLDPRTLTPVRIDQMAQAAINTLYAESGRRGQWVVYQAPEVPIQVLGDEGLLSHIVSTLIGNAITYSAPGSNIWVNCQSTETDMLFTVANPAPEFRAEDCEHVFAPFRRVALTAYRDPHGLGLSLALAEAAARCHGGNLQVTWTSNNGRLIFTLRIPLGHPGLNKVSYGVPHSHR